MKTPLKLLIFTIAAIAGMSLMLLQTTKGPGESGEAITFYCAAGVSQPVELIAAAYTAEYGIPINLQFGGSGTLLSNLQIAKEGDAYLAADESYVELAREKDLIDEAMPVGYLRPVIAVTKENPKNISSLADLTREDVRVALANPDAASIGRVTQELLTRAGQWAEIEAAVQARGVFKPTVNEVANDVKLGSVDAGIVWESVANQYPDVKSLRFPEAADFTQRFMVTVLKTTKNPTRTLHFLRYVTSKDRGLKTFSETGYETVAGDVWAEHPEIVYFSGGVNRIAIEDTIAAFSAREGCTVLTTYNGCGILVSQIEAGERPDVYHTCDASFMAGVEPLFGTVDPISKTDIVIMVQEGNPRNIQGLHDLTQPDLEVGVCTDQLSTLGTMTARLLREAGEYDGVMGNVVVENPQGDMIATQLTVGKLDAVIVYRANTVNHENKADVVEIAAPGWIATQTYAVKRDTPYPNLIERLHARIRGAESQAIYAGTGFDYLEPVVSL